MSWEREDVLLGWSSNKAMGKTTINISIDELEKITAILFKEFRQIVGTEAKVDADYFWHINNDEKYNPYTEPKDLDIGQLSDDIQELRRVLSEGTPVLYDLERLGNILTAISNSTPGDTKK